jgi:tetratricopeptide (TPR) repeat protein
MKQTKIQNIFTIVAFAFIVLLSTSSYAQLNTPRGSQKATVKQTVGITDIYITYSRPSVKEREIWGKLVPYGMNNLGFGTAKESPWRAGANENTIIKFTNDVTFEGQPVKAGKYGLHMVIKENGDADVILSKNYAAWGSFFYNPEEDVAKVTVKTNEVPHKELLTFEFIDVQPTSATAALIWEKKQIPFKIDVAVTDIVLADIRKKMQGQAGFNRLNWEQAANYALNNNGDLDEAMQWIDAAIAGQFFSQKTFNNQFIKSQILSKQGKTAESLKLQEEIIPQANVAQLNTIGYQFLTNGKLAKAIEIFKMNVKKNPTNANVYDSLGEAYKTKGDKKNAIKNYKKSLTLSPNPALKANSIKMLKELGVEAI